MSCEQLLTKVRGIYAGLVMVETKSVLRWMRSTEAGQEMD